MKKAAEILSAFLDDSLLAKGQQYSALFNAWKEIAGEQIAAHSRIREFEKSIIIVEAEHPGWIQLLQTKQRYFIDAFQKKFPELQIRGICFKLAFEKISNKEYEEKEKKIDDDSENNVLQENSENFQKKDDRPETTLKAQDLSAMSEEKIYSSINEDIYKNIHDKELVERLKRLEKEIKKRWGESSS
ncbi:DUF721 domain-containing protein [Treponema sp. J25]|uniref:DUF721 domain-containing protein n=1 Tax=Treponema sp. J25 TaxID=2094121 RepID=UPI001049FA37|nr:DUF721 domain-containing protein [Treponema sp. J25]TCW61735.1 hypothetical protein C5O22_04945 [Treponema sp. J25]